MIYVVRKCQDCPFCVMVDEPWRCAVGHIRNQPIPDKAERPSFCRLRREQIVVREFEDKKKPGS